MIALLVCTAVWAHSLETFLMPVSHEGMFGAIPACPRPRVYDSLTPRPTHVAPAPSEGYVPAPRYGTDLSRLKFAPLAASYRGAAALGV